MAKQADYQAAQNNVPLQQVAELVIHLYTEFHPADELDLILLGPGTAEKEVRLAQYLASAFKKLRVFLLDTSQPLLTFAYKHAVTFLSEFSEDVELFAIMANMHHLPRFLNLLSPTKPKRKRLVAMRGYTFTNLENKLLFVRNSLRGLDEGNLFLVDVGLVAASIDNPEEVVKKELRLAKTIPAGWNLSIDNWLAGPIMRYCRGAKEIHFIEDLDTATCCIPGSYAIEKRAQVTLDNGQKRAFRNNT